MAHHLKSKLYLVVLTGGWKFDLEMTLIVTITSLVSCSPSSSLRTIKTHSFLLWCCHQWWKYYIVSCKTCGLTAVGFCFYSWKPCWFKWVCTAYANDTAGMKSYVVWCKDCMWSWSVAGWEELV